METLVGAPAARPNCHHCAAGGSPKPTSMSHEPTSCRKTGASRLMTRRVDASASIVGLSVCVIAVQGGRVYKAGYCKSAASWLRRFESSWRRFMIIAFEDIGAGSPDAPVMAVVAGADPT